MKTKRLPFLPLSLAVTVALAAGCASFEETLAKANAGDAAAQYRIAKAFAAGEETPKDLGKAEEYLRKAADGGETKAKRALFLLWLETKNVEATGEIVRDYPGVAEGGIFSWGMDTDLLDRAPAFAQALVDAERFDDYRAFLKMVVSTETDLFVERRRNGGSGPGFADTNEIQTFQRLMAPIERRYAEKKVEAQRRAEAADREAKAERERKEAEERKRVEAEREATEKKAREEAEEKWLARKDDPAFRFPLRASFPDSVSVYKEIQTGCSLEWAEEYIRHEGFATTNRIRSFPDMAVGVAEATERPLPEEFDRVEETETSLFVRNPKNLTFFDGGRVVTLTFGSPSPDGDGRFLVSGEIQFPDGGATVEALAEKYADAVHGCSRKETEETTREGGQAILPLIRLPVITTKKSLTVFSSAKAAIKILDNRTVSLFWDSPSSQQIHVDEKGQVSLGDDDLELRILAAPELSGEEVGKALGMWISANNHCGKPAVSIVDRTLFDAMAKAKEEEARLATEQRRAEERAAEEEKRERMKKTLESF